MNFCKVKKLFGIMCACAFFSVTGHQMAYAAPAEETEVSVSAQQEDAEEAQAQSEIGRAHV